MAYAPLGAPGTPQDLIPRKEQKNLLKDPLVQDLAKKYDRT